MSTSTHYDSSYFDFQQTIGEFGGWANSPRFQRHIQPDHDVLDFGCGGGFLLKSLQCRKKLGVEVNPSARTVASKNGVTVFPDIASVPDNAVDVIVSNHCLEHVPAPLDALRQLRSKLRDGGIAMFVVPCEKVSMRWTLNDINQHLYTFTPLNLGNLFTAAGYTVVSSTQDKFKWPPLYRYIARFSGRIGFEIACKLWFYIDRRNSFQVRLLARK